MADTGTFHAKGAGGVVFEFDEPAEGSRAAELLGEKFAKGELIRCAPDGGPVAEAKPKAKAKADKSE